MEFSIENSSEKIWSNKTKEYFREVITAYVSESYRSSIVMLYSIVICDLVYKLQELRDIYNDEVASKIVDEITELQRQNVRSSEWENKLIEFVHNRTNLLEIFDYENIISLQKHRHLSAHPVMTLNYELYYPNRETTRAHIRNMLEGLFVKPAILSKKIIDEFLADLVTKRDILIEDSQLSRYLNARYFTSMPIEVQKRLFKLLWKLVFKISNDDCDINREINFRTLKVLFKNNKAILYESIKEDKPYFSNVSLGEPLGYLIMFLCNQNTIYELLNGDAKVLIEAEVNHSLEKEILGWFTKTSMQEHIKTIEDKLISSTPPISASVYQSLKIIYEVAIEFNQESSVSRLMIIVFGLSKSYDTADNRYENLIAPYISLFSKECLVLLLDKIENNDQIYGRGRSSSANKEIKTYCDKVLGNDFCYELYPNFIERVAE